MMRFVICCWWCRLIVLILCRNCMDLLILSFLVCVVNVWMFFGRYLLLNLMFVLRNW